MVSENQKSILLVEDEVILAISQKMILEGYGYRVLMANNALEAEELFQLHEEIDLVLMDLDLGKGPDGAQVAQKLLSIKDIPVVFLSSHTEADILEKIEQITSYGYVVKGSSHVVLDASLKMAFKLFQANNAVKNNELKQKTMISHISDVIGIIGRDGFLTYISPNIEKWFGWKPEELVGKDNWVTVHPDELEEIHKGFNANLKEEGASLSLEYRYKCKDGNYKPMELTATNLSQDRVICGVLINFRDISERKRAERILREREIEALVAQQANRAKDEFIASISHELRTPLTAIIGLAQTIVRFKERGQLGEGKLESLMQNILSAGEQLEELVEDIIDYSEIEAGNTKLEIAVVDMGDLIEEILVVLGKKALEKQLTVQNKVKANVLVWADHQRVKQIVWNLLDNAIKFTSKGEVTLQLEKQGNYADLQVIDTGMGITPGEKERVFQRFVRLDKSGQKPGAGLGLPLSLRLAQLMGGDISVESEWGKGAVFNLRLPLYRAGLEKPKKIQRVKG